MKGPVTLTVKLSTSGLKGDFEKDAVTEKEGFANG